MNQIIASDRTQQRLDHKSVSELDLHERPSAFQPKHEKNNRKNIVDRFTKTIKMANVSML